MAAADLEQKQVVLAAVVALGRAPYIVLGGEGGAVHDLKSSAHDQRHGHNGAGAHDEHSCFAQRGLSSMSPR